MDQSKWICERCRKGYDAGKGEGWITLLDDETSYYSGKLTSLIPYDKVCYCCADELLAIVENCDKQCDLCEAVIIWGLSIADCLRFQLKFEIIDLQEKEFPEGSLEEAEKILRTFRFQFAAN